MSYSYKRRKKLIKRGKWEVMVGWRRGANTILDLMRIPWNEELEKSKLDQKGG